MLTVGFNIAVGGISFFAVILFSVALRKGWLSYWAYPVSDAVPSNIELLFQEERLIDVSPNAKILLPMFCEPTLEGAGDFFSHRFDNIAREVHRLAPHHKIALTSNLENDQTVLELERFECGFVLRILASEQDITMAQVAYRKAIDLEQILHFLDHAPMPSWMIGSDGQLVFGNQAYQEKISKLPEAQELPVGVHRLTIDGAQVGEKTWLDITVQEHGKGKIFTAMDVTKIVRAEIAQRNFVQTLTKTFANLSIGLAIFDRNRQLVLFNPALIDLTDLPAEFLSARPTLLSFFGKLRDQRVMPEPKDYSNWREQLAQLVVASSEGTYCEVWSLPSGATYRVSGRPHPDGAIALLFEDISEEIILTRRFRNETELNQSIMDALDTGFAVFSAAGLMISCNRSYAELWQVDHDISLGEVSILDAIRIWSNACAPSPDFADLRDFVMDQTDREEWSAEFRDAKGGRLNCKITPLAGAMTLVAFDRISLPELALI